MTSAADSDPTVAPGEEAAPPLESFAAEGPRSDEALPLKSCLAEFEIVDLIGVGGFGIVYLALDRSLERQVAIKEYMPRTLACRDRGTQIKVRSARYQEAFDAGRRSFVNEARMLARFDHPSLVKVYRFWEANGTAYMVMPFYEGRTLAEVLRSLSGPPDQAWLQRLLVPLLDALDLLHQANVYHRDIAPDNILVLTDGRPLLLDFGAARRVISDMTQALTVILKPGYAPIEQYAEMAQMKQGAWTDLYALAAVVYFAILGKTPPPAVSRLVNDTFVPLSGHAPQRYSNAFLKAIDAALALRPEARPHTVAAFRAELATASAAPKEEGSAGSTGPATTAAAVRTSQRTMPWAAAGGVVAVTVAAVVGWRLAAAPPEVEASRQPPASSPTVPPAPASAAVPPSSRVLAPTARAFDPTAELDRIFEQRNRAHNVSVVLEQSQVVIGRDRLNFSVRSTHPGYLYVLMVGTDHQHLYLLFPNQIDQDNRMAAHKPVDLPRKDWSMVARGPAGTNQFVAIVAEHPRDFRASGLKTVGAYAEFVPAPADPPATDAADAPSAFTGRAVCTAGSAPCSQAYGASVFTIEEVEATRR